MVMADLRSAYQGCLLGLAVGDAMGYTVDEKSYEDICKDYGPDGLLGYDLVNGYAQISAHTQIASFVCNGLLLGITHEQRGRRTAPYTQYIALALREWVHTQRHHKPLPSTRCWVYHMEQLRHRCCSDIRMIETLHRPSLGTLEAPINWHSTPSSLVAAVPVGLLFHPSRMEVSDVGVLGAEAVALTHGNPMAFLSGAALAYMIAGIVQEPESPLTDHFTFAATAVASQFSREYSQAADLYSLLRKAVTAALAKDRKPQEFMQQLRCENSAQVLAGAVYAALASDGDFDRAMIIAVNHSGCSAAVGAVTGALMGAKMGIRALPDFYLEGLEPAAILKTLSGDMAQSCLSGTGPRLFDDEWDHRYLRGQPPSSGEFSGSDIPDFLA